MTKLTDLLGEQLLQHGNNGNVLVSTSQLEGKVVALYFS